MSQIKAVADDDDQKERMDDEIQGGSTDEDENLAQVEASLIPPH